MSKSPYKRKPGDLEIRILSDGRVVMVAPDEELMEVARTVGPNSAALEPTTETNEDAAGRKAEADQES
ncbi:MAG: hypothetical protein ACYTE3_05170 [Planctomycetota bacterium]|jgi:hypothetical protein